jgi:hypothetical protein
MYYIRNCRNHFSVFNGKNGGCYQCNPGYVVSKDQRNCVDLKPYLGADSTKEARDVLSCRIFKYERPGDCEYDETDTWTYLEPGFGKFEPNDNSYSSSEGAENGIRKGPYSDNVDTFDDVDSCQAPPLPGAAGDGNGTARTLATQALEKGHWECGECLKDATADPNNMKCTSKTKKVLFHFTPTVKYENVEQSTIEVVHYDDTFKCVMEETKKPLSYDTPVVNQYMRNAEYVGVGNKIGVCTCPDLSEHIVGVYMTNNTLACHNYYSTGTVMNGVGWNNQNKMWCSHKSSHKCVIDVGDHMKYR